MLRKLFFLFVITLFPIVSYAKNSEWLIYFYMVGSDLETDSGDATSDILELVKSKTDSSDNVRILLLTGGAKKWNNDTVSAKSTDIYEIVHGDIKRIQQFENLNMGNSSTLVKFLKYGEEQFKANKRAIIFWNHGGGATGGIGYDELHNDDFLTMPEINQAFTKIFGTPNPDNPIFELIGFDACLMATFDVAYQMKNWGNYMVASEEMEPYLGWYHTPWVAFLEKNPKVSGEKLGKAIADAYIQACQKEDLEDVTLSVIDLQKIDYLAYEFFSVGLNLMSDFISAEFPEEVLAQIEKAAQKSEKYGTAYGSDTIDLAEFINNLPVNGNSFNKVYNEAILYKINGKYRNSTGLSIYYPISEDYKDGFEYVKSHGVINPIFLLNAIARGIIKNKEIASIYKNFTVFYQDLENKLLRIIYSDNNKADYIKSINIKKIPKINASLDKLGELPITFDKDYNSVITIPKNLLNAITKVELFVTTITMPEDGEDGEIVILGSDNIVNEDWEQGKISDNFNNSWPAMDGKYYLPIKLVESNDRFSRYDCLVKVNDIYANMEIIYDYNLKEYKIINVTKVSDDGIPSRYRIKLSDGDKITTVFEYIPIKADNSDEYDDEADEKDVAVKAKKEKIKEISDNKDESNEDEASDYEDEEGDDDDDDDDDDEILTFDYETFEYNKNMKITDEDFGAGDVFGIFFRITSLSGETAESEMSILISKEDVLEVYSYGEYMKYLEEKESE